MFPEGAGVVNVTDPEGGPTATGMIPEGGTVEKNCKLKYHVVCLLCLPFK